MVGYIANLNIQRYQFRERKGERNLYKTGENEKK